jgi:hypothetical protein
MHRLVTLTTIQFHPIECTLFRVRCATAYGLGHAACCLYVNLESLELNNTPQIYTSILNLRWLTSQHPLLLVKRRSNCSSPHCLEFSYVSGEFWSDINQTGIVMLLNEDR